jgi:hypothetical protein
VRRESFRCKAVSLGKMRQNRPHAGRFEGLGGRGGCGLVFGTAADRPWHPAPGAATPGRARSRYGAVSSATVHRTGSREQSHSRTTKIPRICDIRAVHFSRRPRAGPEHNGLRRGSPDHAPPRVGFVHMGSKLDQSHGSTEFYAALGSFFPAPTTADTSGIWSVRFGSFLGTTSLGVWFKDELGSFFPGVYGRPRRRRVRERIVMLLRRGTRPLENGGHGWPGPSGACPGCRAAAGARSAWPRPPRPAKHPAWEQLRRIFRAILSGRLEVVDYYGKWLSQTWWKIGS